MRSEFRVSYSELNMELVCLVKGQLSKILSTAHQRASQVIMSY